MAKTVRIFLTCDLHGQNDQVEGMASIAFGYEGKLLELDVCRQHFDQFTETVSPWATAARSYGTFGAPPMESEGKPRTRRESSGESRSMSKAQLAAVRDWARSNGLTVSERGRISAKVIEAFNHANSQPVEKAAP